MSEKPKEDPLAKFLAGVKKDFTKSFPKSETEFIKASEEPDPTGIIVDNPLLEFILDRRFLAYGRCYLIYGNKADGKTSFFYDLAKLFQRNNGIVIWLETENAPDKIFAAKQGVDMSRVHMSHPRTLEEALTAAEAFVDNMPKAFPDGDVPVLICLDSIAGSVTDYESEQNVIGDVKPGEHAKLLANFYRRFTDKLSHEKCIFLAINQLKEQIGAFGGFGEEKPEAMIGGRAPRFHSTYQFKFARTGDITAPDPKHPGIKRKIGSSHKLTVKRNKLGREGNSQFIEVDNMAEGGYTWYESLVDQLAKYYKEIIVGSAAYYKWQIPNTKFFNPNSKEIETIDTERNYLKRDMATILANSEEAKEHIRRAYKIPDLPSIEEVIKVENENKKKRNKKKLEEAPKGL